MRRQLIQAGKKMVLTLKNARIYTCGKFKRGNVIIKDGVIAEISDREQGQVVDAGGRLCVAGYIDIHTHGGWGKDCMETTKDAIDTISRYHLYTGTTSYVPTTMTASVEDINKAVANIREYKSKYARILGIHLEGPYLAQKSAGAHPPQFLMPPSKDDSFVFDNDDIVARVTLAPNLDGAAEFCKKATQRGIQVSMGHDDSIDDEIYACVESGADSVTHMYNCTSRPSRRVTPKKHLGLTEVGLADGRITDEVIADDRHVPNALFKMIYRLKGAQGICLVSDSLSVAGMPDGDYYLGSGASAQKIKIDDNVAILPDLNTYAGSVTPVGKMVANLHSIGIPLEDCIDMCTKTPAALLKRDDIGDIAVGKRGDINLLNDDLSIYATVLDGVLIDRQALEI
ncbi:MAG: N-acetylglucosamine-6-phosphate deacetylase [Clostridia bacterium]|nr:N-acetylglucosamine-6-phosphate deacetylase [Clostridia bacterium]MCI8944365.1 N-acetylglucosamine-6-phosphate deacetylase [Clostridia bacterium]MCI9291063.1 N-acetylglucosamine-6-phosphate deacetylase [Clostridia bacterium]